MASESGFYLGAEIGSTHEQDKQPGLETSNTSTSYAINGGYYINQNNRAYAFYSYISEGDYASNTDMYGAGYDYLIGTSPLKPFIGAIVAYTNFSYPGFTINGMAYGAQVGVDYSVNGNLAIDAGYKYLVSDAKEGAVETESYGTLFIGANYKF